MLRPGELLIGDHNWQQHVADPVVDGEHKARGLIPRDYTTHPQGCYRSVPAWSVDMPLIPRGEWSERIRDKVASKSQLSDIRLTGNNGQMIPSLDQNGQGFCWAYSSTSCVTVMRAVQGQPYVRLSAHAVACKIKNFRDEGGWGAHSAEFITANGVPSVAFWPEKSMSRSNDKPEVWENAKLHRIAEGWVDLAPPVYDRNLTFEQYITSLLCNCPGVFDANFWSHSIAGLDAVDGAEQRLHTRDPESGKLLQLADFDLAWGMNDPVTGGIGVRIWNSWGDGWSDRGMSVLSGSKAVPDGSVAIRVTTPSVV